MFVTLVTLVTFVMFVTLVVPTNSVCTHARMHACTCALFKHTQSSWAHWALYARIFTISVQVPTKGISGPVCTLMQEDDQLVTHPEGLAYSKVSWKSTVVLCMQAHSIK